MPALLEAVADLEVEELEIVPSAAPAADPKRVLETVVIGPHGLEAPSIVAYPPSVCFVGCVCSSCCACGCHNGCMY